MTQRYSFTALLALVALACAACAAADDLARSAADRNRAVDELERQAGAPVALEVGEAGDLRVLAMTPRFPVPGHATDPAIAARDFLEAHHDVFRLDAIDATRFAITRVDSDRAGDLRHVTLQRVYDGIPVFQGAITIHMDAGNGVFRALGDDSYRIAPPTNRLVLDPADAVSAAGRALRVKLSPVLATSDGQHTVFGSVGTLDPIAVDRAIFHVAPGDDRFAYQVIVSWLDDSKQQQYQMALVDAADGSLLARYSLVNTFTGRVFNVHAQPTAAQSADTRSVVSFDGNPVASPLGWVGTARSTAGNNAVAATDLDGNNAIGVNEIQPVASAGDAFDFPYAATQSASNFKAAAVVNAFFFANDWHDRTYALGFTEASGNFQSNNFGKGGMQNDPVNVDAQDASSTNNANFATPPDGSRPRMQMFLFNIKNGAGGITQDGDFDPSVVYHEITHGLSNRLVGGGSTGCLGGVQSGGMGEGWSDWLAASFLDNPVIGAYVTGNATLGIRHASMASSPFTYGDIQDGTMTEVHDAGEVWAATLWDVRTAVGAAIAEQLVVSGMKLTPCNPTMLQARDAIIQADATINGGANACKLYAAFAGRGMGIGASSPHHNSTSTISLSTSIPSSCGPSLPLPPPRVAVDTRIRPAVASLPGIGGGPPRPMTSLKGESGTQVDFTQNELIVVTDDPASLNALLARWTGTVLRETDFSTLARAYDANPGAGPHYYLVHIDPSNANISGLPPDLQALRGSGGGRLTVASVAAQKLLAVATSEVVHHGMTVGLNFFLHGASIATGSTVEAASGPGGYNPDAFTWSYMGSGAGFVQDIGVAQAWQQLQAAGKFSNRVSALVLDGGFARAIAGPDLPPVEAMGAVETPNPFGCGSTGAMPCPWHGTEVMSAMAALPDNRLGAAGPAGPVAQLAFVQSPRLSVTATDVSGVIEDIVNSLGNTLEYIAEARSAIVTTRPRIINISGGFYVPGEIGLLVSPLDPVVSHLRNDLGILVFVAAGNDGKDVDANKCYGWGDPVPGHCVGVIDEAEVAAPCEVPDVICVGGLGNNVNTRAITSGDSSNWGSRQRFSDETSDDPATPVASVDIYGPYCVWVAATPEVPTVHQPCGTSFSSPFVAGVAALIWAADPSLTANQVHAHLLASAHRRNEVESGVGGLVVNARGAVQRVLGIPPTLSLRRVGSFGAASLNREFEIDAIVSDPDSSCCTITWMPPPALDIALANGRRGRFRFASIGDQVLTARATDVTGNTVEASITISVVNNPPIATMSLPATTTTVYRGQPVSLVGFATDQNEGAGPDPGTLGCDRLTFASSWAADSAILPRVPAGIAPNCTTIVTFTTNGTRIISLDARDSQGTPPFSPPGRFVTVVDPPPNLPPSALVALPVPNFRSGYAWDLPIQITASATDPENNTPIQYRWTATTYRPDSATVYAGPTVIRDWSSSGNVAWSPSVSTPSLFGSYADFGNDCYHGQPVKLVLEARDSLGNTSSLQLSTILVYSCILR